MRLHSLFGRHVNLRPELRVGAELDHRRVEGPERRTDVLEALEIPGVTAVVDPVFPTGDDPGRRQRVLGVPQPTPAEVPSRGGRERQPGDLGRLVPGQLTQPARGHAPVLHTGYPTHP